MAVGMWPEHFLHSVARAKSKVTYRIKLTEAAAQTWPRGRVAVVPLHHGKPIEKQSDQRQPVPLCCLSSDVTQPTFCQRKDHVRLEILDRRLQCGVSHERPDKVFVIDDPRCQSWTEPAFSYPIDKVR